MGWTPGLSLVWQEAELQQVGRAGARLAGQRAGTETLSIHPAPSPLQTAFCMQTCEGPFPCPWLTLGKSLHLWSILTSPALKHTHCLSHTWGKPLSSGVGIKLP